MDSDHLIETHELTKRYGDRAAVDAVNLTVRRGEVYGFLGPNGAGKTTTLRMLLGLIRPTSGTAQILGMPLGSAGIIPRVGALVEGPGFYPYLSGRENLRVLARYRGMADRHVDHALDRVDLTERGGDRFRSYSLGMKQRLGVAAALLGDPDLVVLDEPTNGLDPAGIVDMRALITDLAARGTTVLLSSHMLAEVQETCHRVGVIQHGVLRVEAEVDALLGDRETAIDVSPVDAALAVLAHREEFVRRDGDSIIATVGPEETPGLVADLVGAGVRVSRVAPRARTLADAFFEVTDRDRTTDDEGALTR